MLSTKPYLIRAIYEWCVDQGFTPYLAVRVDERTHVPSGYVRDGQIVLNVGPEATNQLVMDNEQVSFQARFNGVVYQIVTPVDNVAAIYARENGQGMAFELQGVHPAGIPVTGTELPPDGRPPPAPPRGSHLKVIK
ncbi:MAG: ClpXP protease specificity-enhancing factor [Azoarcus sp.]|jgi:stringent starvation protein B|nr:ClpXP protease specificity-enhancing factor [Azoarcus sp.]